MTDIMEHDKDEQGEVSDRVQAQTDAAEIVGIAQLLKGSSNDLIQIYQIPYNGINLSVSLRMVSVELQNLRYPFDIITDQWRQATIRVANAATNETLHDVTVRQPREEKPQSLGTWQVRDNTKIEVNNGFIPAGELESVGSELREVRSLLEKVANGNK